MFESKNLMKIVFIVLLFLIILPLIFFILIQFAPPEETAASADSTATESSGKTTAQERHARRTETRTARNESREGNTTATVEYDMAPEPGLTEGEIADRRNGIVGAINPNGRGKQATPYRPDEVPGDSGVIVQYAGSPDDMPDVPPPPQDDLWGGRTPPPITPANMRGIGGVRRIDPNDPFFQQDIPNPFTRP